LKTESRILHKERVGELFERIENTHFHTSLTQCQDISVVVAHKDITIGVSHILCS
jgi:hypothetical protein